MELERKNVLPNVMKRENIDMWLVTGNQDFVYASLLPTNEEGMSLSRPRFVVYLYNREKSIAKYKEARNAEELTQIIEDARPRTIGINEGEKSIFEELLDETYKPRFVSSRPFSMGWLEAKSPREISAYRHVVGVAHDIIARAYSNQVIIPDVTNHQ